MNQYSRLLHKNKFKEPNTPQNRQFSDFTTNIDDISVSLSLKEDHTESIMTDTNCSEMDEHQALAKQR